MTLGRRALPEMRNAPFGYNRPRVRAFLNGLVASSREVMSETRAALDASRARNRALLAARRHVVFRLESARLRASIVGVLEGTASEACLQMLDGAREEAGRLLAAIRPELESCAAEAARIEAETSKARATRGRILDGIQKLIEPPREGRRVHPGAAPRVIKPVMPSLDVGGALERLEDEIGALEMQYVVGNVAGRDLLTSSGVIVRAGEVITADAYRRALAQGKIAELIVYMMLPGDGPEATGGGSGVAGK